MNEVFSQQDQIWMERAIDMAYQAYLNQEVPIGAVLVSAEGQMLAEAANQMEALQCQTGHAEISVIRQACKNLSQWRLTGATLYVSLEPCLMCFGLISLSRVNRLIYAAESPLFGFTQTPIDKSIYHKHVKVQSGLKRERSAAILKMFFADVRRAKGEKRGQN